METVNTAAEILQEVADLHNLTPAIIRQSDRIPDHYAARLQAWYRIRKELNYSYALIGRIVNRDHTTVHRGVKIMSILAETLHKGTEECAEEKS
jgi:chromosomal replication initiation ATPase DnaA